MAARFDIGRLAAAGPAVPLFDIGPPSNDSVAFEGTDAGLLAYRSGSPGPSTLVWVDRAGTVTPFARRCAASLTLACRPTGSALSRPARTISGSTTWLETRFRSSRFKVAPSRCGHRTDVRSSTAGRGRCGMGHLSETCGRQRLRAGACGKATGSSAERRQSVVGRSAPPVRRVVARYGGRYPFAFDEGWRRPRFLKALNSSSTRRFRPTRVTSPMCPPSWAPRRCSFGQ